MIAIDLGSNTLRVIEYDCNGHFGLSFDKMVKTADGLTATGMISQEAVDRIIAAIKEAKTMIDFNSHKVTAVTTEAMRRAFNSHEALQQIFESTGVAFEIITPEREAELALHGVKKRLELLGLIGEDEPFALIDIGGGSTEIIFNRDGKSFARSFEIGIVTLTQRFSDSANLREDIHTVMQPIESFAAEAREDFGPAALFIATAGTPTTLAAMKLGMDYQTYDSERINGTSLYKNEIDPLLNRLLSMNHKEQEKAVGVGRSDLIETGIHIFEHLYTILGFDECITIDDGLREGVAYDACQKHDKTSNRK